MALVPTMGALHAGHMALIEEGKRRAETVAATIFVNPMQFGANEDFGRYPRRPGDDARMLEDAGCDLLWMPSVDDIYPQGFSTSIHISGVSEQWEGAARPGHFDGVATVVLKLFQRVRPQAAYFGRKDAQQLAVIRRMVADLDVPVEIRPIETVRDADGLAVSSRNVYLSAQERRAAPSLHRALVARDPSVCQGEVDYLAVVDPDTFDPVPPRPGALVIGAARFGTTRLIDNIALEEAS